MYVVSEWKLYNFYFIGSVEFSFVNIPCKFKICKHIRIYTIHYFLRINLANVN